MLGTCTPACNPGERCNGSGACVCGELENVPGSGPVCGTGEVCESGICRTPGAACAGDGDCAAAERCCGGECVDLSSDLGHCGACGSLCDQPNASETCVAGSCEVDDCIRSRWGQPLYYDCDASPGCETPRGNLNCGACGALCGSGERCNGSGQCVCGEVVSAPGGGRICPIGEYCDGVGCRAPSFPCAVAAECPIAGQACCDGSCVDLSNDPLHCGACGAVCDFENAEESCVAGSCVFEGCLASTWGYPLYFDCEGDLGCETPRGMDHCGACGVQCVPGERCNGSGQCVCGTREGRPGEGSRCVKPHSVMSCDGGACVFEGCEPGWVNCEGDGPGCATPEDTSNCGSCGRTCLPGQLCDAGDCVECIVDSDCPAGSSCVAGTCPPPCDDLGPPGWTLQQRIDAAPDGSILYVAGPISENVVLDGRTLTLRGACDGGMTTWTCADNAVRALRIIGSSDVTLERFVIENCMSGTGSTNLGGAIVFSADSDLLIRESVLRNNSSWRGGAILGAGGGANRFRMVNSIVRHNIADDGGAIYITGEMDIDFNNALIYRNFAFDFSGGVWLRDQTNRSGMVPYVVRSVIWGNTSSRSAGLALYNSAFGYLDDSILDDNVPSDYEGEWADLYTSIGGSHPYFVDPENGDFRLLAGRGTIDGGDPTHPHDPDGSVADRGCRLEDLPPDP